MVITINAQMAEVVRDMTAKFRLDLKRFGNDKYWGIGLTGSKVGTRLTNLIGIKC
jgi:hypothetical protein